MNDNQPNSEDPLIPIIQEAEQDYDGNVDLSRVYDVITHPDFDIERSASIEGLSTVISSAIDMDTGNYTREEYQKQTGRILEFFEQNPQRVTPKAIKMIRGLQSMADEELNGKRNVDERDNSPEVATLKMARANLTKCNDLKGKYEFLKLSNELEHLPITGVPEDELRTAFVRAQALRKETRDPALKLRAVFTGTNIGFSNPQIAFKKTLPGEKPSPDNRLQYGLELEMIGEQVSKLTPEQQMRFKAMQVELAQVKRSLENPVQTIPAPIEPTQGLPAHSETTQKLGLAGKVFGGIAKCLFGKNKIRANIEDPDKPKL
jgi:hypothetical protein